MISSLLHHFTVPRVVRRIDRPLAIRNLEGRRTLRNTTRGTCGVAVIVVFVAVLVTEAE